MELFSSSYAEARERFLTKAQALGAAVEHHSVQGDSSGDEELFIDSAYLGEPAAEKIFVILSGTHGLEGLAGSAAQLSLLQGNPTLPEGLGILLIHAVNPYGFAKHSRANEDNIDLNRNFGSFSGHPTEFTEVELAVRKALAPADFSLEQIETVAVGVAELFATHEPQAVLNAITAGQYISEEGLNFGGREAARSNIVVRDVIKRHAVNAKKVVLLDWHTGLGEFAEPFFISFNEVKSTSYSVSKSWWGDEVFDDNSAFGAGSARPDYRGVLVAGIGDELPEDAEVVRVVIEFGTYDVPRVLGALVADQWLRKQSGVRSTSGDTQELRDWMREQFIPADPSWRDAVISISEDIHQKTLAGLAGW